jgi:hypothetical protein
MVLTGIAGARPIDPAMDDGPGPFCYFSRPTTVLGVPDALVGTQVTGEGWLWTGSAELVFLVGPDLKPMRQRVQMLAEGCLPIVNYSYERDGVTYAVTMFGATLDGKPESNLINFVRVAIRNNESRRKTATFAVAFRGEGPGTFTGMTRAFSFLTAKYAFGPDCATRDDRVIYTFGGKPRRFVVADKEGEAASARDEMITRGTLVCAARYDLEIAGRGEQKLDFKMPYAPVAVADTAAVAALRAASYDDYLSRTRKFWRDYLGQGTQVEVPEAKVVDTAKASAAYLAIARDRRGDDHIVCVNKFQYHSFFVRDSAYIAAAFDFWGRHDWAAQGIDFYMKYTQADGMMYTPPCNDGFGQVLWVAGNHWRLTGDMAYARRMYPRLAAHVRGAFSHIQADPLGLVPPAPPYDNEAINGHYTGDNFFVMAGMRDTIAVAKALGESDDARQFQAWYDGFSDNFLKRARAVAEKHAGYLPPGMDAENGCDWGNLLLLYPRGGVPSVGNVEPTDPMVGVTMDTVRAKKYAEGIMTYGPGLKWGTLHHYLTMKATENLTTMNRQRDALADLYAVLAHTSSTHAGFECGIPPWDNRDAGGNFPPHGWMAAKYMALVRNMLVREWKGDLHLLSVVSPAWVKPGATIALRKAPTDFGDVSVEAKVLADGMQVHIDQKWRSAPARMVLHVPWFARATVASADGKPVTIAKAEYGEGQEIALPATARDVRVNWKIEKLPDVSYDATVAAWKAENRRHFDEYVAGGGKPEPLWGEGELIATKAQREELWSRIRTAQGIAVGCKATASPSEDANPPENAVDGLVDRASYWGATPWPAWWQVDLGDVKTIDHVRVVTYWDDGAGGRYYQYRVAVSTDGQQWKTVADMSENTELATPAGRVHYFEGTPARYVRVDMLKHSANTGVHLVEVIVFAAPDAPVVAAPAEVVDAWTAEAQSGSQAQDFPGWGLVGAERMVLQGDKIMRRGDRVRLEFRGGQQGGIEIADVSIARVDPANPSDIVPASRVPVTFGRTGRAELPAGKAVQSDWIRFDLVPGKDYAVTFAVMTTGATTLWPDMKTRRYEIGDVGAALAAKWSGTGEGETYNLYFLAKVETGQ